MVQPPITPIRIDRRDQIKDTAIQQVGDLFQSTILVTEIPRRVSDGLGALHLVSVNVAIDIHAGLALTVPDSLRRDFETPQIAAIV